MAKKRFNVTEKDRYYLAYGSNLSVEQMAFRCPDAVYVGYSFIKDYELLFKGSKTGSYLTIEKKEGSCVPVVIWRISEADEKNLDRYEGCPHFYYKKMMKVKVHSFRWCTSCMKSESWECQLQATTTSVERGTSGSAFRTSI